MLKKFEVKNYKGFMNKMVWDLSSTRTYTNYKNLVNNKISKNSIVYGKNGSGKSNLCSALMDITNHLLDVEKDLNSPYKYSYIGNDDKTVEFKYVFVFDKKEITYFYKKHNTQDLLLEQLFVNGVEIIRHNFIETNDNFIKIKGFHKLRTDNISSQLSILKYIYNNSIIDEDNVIYKIFEFVKGMLCFKSIREGNQYIGYKLGNANLDNIILTNNKLLDFQLFLSKMGVNYKLEKLSIGGGNETIGVRFKNGNVVPLSKIASSGTKSFILFYCWSIEFKNLSFLIIDEFDAYFHYEAAKRILEIINEYNGLQSVVTTHDVTLLNTHVTRPDCAYVIDENGVINLSDRINKDIRKNHNIEKMYREGEFDKYYKRRDD